MNILITGADGYLGWPLLLKLNRAFPDAKIIGIDNFSRRRWVSEAGSVSAIPILSMDARLKASRKEGFNNISFYEVDLAVYPDVRLLISIHRPEIVIHAAAQPSATYAQINAEKAAFTQDNNVAMTRNILWALREEGLVKTHFIETTTTGIYGAPSFEIPEGDIEAAGADGKKDMIPYPNMASSWYHVSKGFNATNMQLMHFQTGIPVTDVRTSIIYGADTVETLNSPELATRFDFDYYFGTIFNRWMAMAVIGEPVTIYGSGMQIKPFIHIEDAAQSLVDIAKKGNNSEYRIYNQLTEYIRIKDLAETITGYMKTVGKNTGIMMIPNPRVEKEKKSYCFKNNKFLGLLSKEPKTMQESTGEIFDKLQLYKDTLITYRDRLSG